MNLFFHGKYVIDLALIPLFYLCIFQHCQELTKEKKTRCKRFENGNMEYGIVGKAILHMARFSLLICEPLNE